MDGGPAKTKVERVFGAPGILGRPISALSRPDANARQIIVDDATSPILCGRLLSLSVRFQSCNYRTTVRRLE